MMAAPAVDRPAADPSVAEPVQVDQHDARTLVLRPTAEQAAHAYRHLPYWLADVRGSLPGTVVIDLSRARRLDFTAFGALLAKLRELGVPVVIERAAPYLAETLRELDLLAGAEVTTRRRGRARSGTAA